MAIRRRRRSRKWPIDCSKNCNGKETNRDKAEIVIKLWVLVLLKCFDEEKKKKKHNRRRQKVPPP